MSTALQVFDNQHHAGLHHDGRSDLRSVASGLQIADVQLLGGFELLAGGEPAEVPESAQRLIAFLALRRRPQTRLCIAGNLWPEKNDERATANLRSTLWRTRLDDGSSVLKPKGSLIGVAPGVRVDVWDVEAVKPETLAAAYLAGDVPDYERLFDELLPGWYDDWVIIERERLAQLQLKIAEALARSLIERGDHISATDIAFRTLALDSLGDTKDRITSWIP
jgi:DNA-binding SARP family transcriptional activator